MIRRHLSAAGLLARDPGVPRWLRALLIFGALPIPGPVDNVALVVAVAILVTCYRARITAAYFLVDLEPLELSDTWGGWA